MKNKHILSFQQHSTALILVCTLLLASGCSWSDPYSRPPARTIGTSAASDIEQNQTSIPVSRQHAIVNTALSQVGTPYQFGGSDPDGFDCSGLVHYSHAQNGIAVPRTTSEQLNYFSSIPKTQLQAGDLAFFKTGRNQYHVAIMLNKHEFVHAPSTGKKVSVSNFSNPYWKKRFLRAGRY